MVRDEEIKRLIKYAEGMGLRVFFSTAKTGDAASWTLDGTEIVVNTKECNSKIEIILSLIHELGHHVWFIHEKDRQKDLKFEEAIDRQNLVEENLSPIPAPKKHRQKIYDCEKAGTLYWESIYKETNMKFPIWRLYAAMETDMWVYEEYLKTGFFPKRKDVKNVCKEVNKKHKNKKYE